MLRRDDALGRVAEAWAPLEAVAPARADGRLRAQDGQSKDDGRYLEGSLALLSSEGRRFSHRLRRFLDDNWAAFRTFNASGPLANRVHDGTRASPLTGEREAAVPDRGGATAHDDSDDDDDDDGASKLLVRPAFARPTVARAVAVRSRFRLGWNRSRGALGRNGRPGLDEHDGAVQANRHRLCPHERVESAQRLEPWRLRRPDRRDDPGPVPGRVR